MDIERLNRTRGMATIGMSALAFVAVAVGVATGWDKVNTGQGKTAYMLQILVISQTPIIVLAFTTADWRRMTKIARAMAIRVLTFMQVPLRSFVDKIQPPRGHA